MKVVVIGGTGMLGSQIVAKLQEGGHEAVAASPDSGVDTITGAGLAEALAGAGAVVDAANAPAWGDEEVLEFFQTASRNLTAAAREAGIAHYVAMSIVGADRLPDSGYLRAKVAQEEIVAAAGLPFTIVRATQFFEFVERIGEAGANGAKLHLPSALFQPVAASELAAAVAAIAAAEPAGGIVEVGGPEPLPIDRTVARFLAAKGDEREVVGDPHAQYFGTELNTESLVPDDSAQLTATRFEEWLARQ